MATCLPWLDYAHPVWLEMESFVQRDKLTEAGIARQLADLPVHIPSQQQQVWNEALQLRVLSCTTSSHCDIRRQSRRPWAVALYFNLTCRLYIPLPEYALQQRSAANSFGCRLRAQAATSGGLQPYTSMRDTFGAYSRTPGNASDRGLLQGRDFIVLRCSQTFAVCLRKCAALRRSLYKSA